jgi:hypothetical protein
LFFSIITLSISSIILNLIMIFIRFPLIFISISLIFHTLIHSFFSHFIIDYCLVISYKFASFHLLSSFLDFISLYIITFFHLPSLLLNFRIMLLLNSYNLNYLLLLNLSVFFAIHFFIYLQDYFIL